MSAVKLGRLRLGGGFLLLLAAVLLLDAGRALLWALPPVLFHELGHLLAVRQCGGRVRGVTLTATGAVLETADLERAGYGAELYCALSGCLYSFLLAGGASLYGRLCGGGRGAYLIAGLSLVLGVFNLLPAWPLDGGRALYLLIAPRRGVAAAERLLRATSLLTALAALATGAWLLLRTGANFTLLAAGGYLLAQLRPRRGIKA